MGNKRLKKRAYSLKGLGRRGLSLLMAMVMTLSLVQISAFAEEDVAENQPDPLKPDTVENVNGHGINLTKTAQRVGDTEWEVTVRADIGDTRIKQQPLDVVFVLDKSGSMMFCTDPDHDKGDHEHSMWCYQRVWVEDDSLLGGHYERQLTCTKKEVRHEVPGGWGDATDWLPCQYKDENGKWVNYETRLESAKAAMTALENSLPAGANVQYVSFSDDAKQENSLNDVVADGGTNIMAGVDKGIDLLKKNQSTVTKKVLVLLSDGEATAGVEPGNRYTSEKFRQFTSNPKNDVYTVGFALDNPKLKEMAKGDGEYIYANNAEALNSAFTELSTRIAAMIVDPMSNEVSYVSGSAKDGPKENEDFKTVKGNITLDSDGRTLRWTPMDTDSFSNTVIQYTYRVNLNPSEDAGNYTGIKLNNPTYLQYGIEQNGNKTAYTGQFNIPEGFYQVSTLEEKFVALNDDGTESEITDSKQRPNDFQSEVTDYITEEEPTTELKVYAPIQALDTNDEHVKYVYQYSKMIDTLDGTEVSNDIINVKDENNAFTTKYEAPYDQNVVDVTNKHDAYELIHYYKQYTVNSVEYKYADGSPETGIPALGDEYKLTWYPTGTKDIEVQPDVESDMYTFSGWEKVRGEAEIKTDENGKKTFDLVLDEDNHIESGDVLFEGSWTLKPSYRVVANYYTRVDGEFDIDKPDNTNGPISLTSGVNDDDVIYVDEGETGEYDIQPGDYSKWNGVKYNAVEVKENGTMSADGATVTDITPTEGTTTVLLYFYHDTKTPVEYTVTHEYYDVDPDGNETLVAANTAVDTYRGEHEETIQAADVPAKNVDTYTETGRSPESIQLNKKAEATPNITITYKHYEYRVTVTGDAGVTAINGNDFTYGKGKNGSVNFKLKPGYKLASVTDQAGTDEAVAVTASADVNGVYSYSIRNIQANHHVDIKTEQIPYTLTVKYEFSDKSTHNGFDTIVKNDYFYGQDYKAEQKAAPAGYHFVEATGDPAEGKITKNIEVTFHYAKNGDGVVIVNYLEDGTNEVLKDSKTKPGTIGTAYDLSSTACGEQYVVKSITKGNVVYDLVSEPTMTGIFQEKAVIDLYYKERDKNSVVVKYQSESNDPKFALDADVMEKTYTDYVDKNYDVSGSEYVPETIVDIAGNTWYRSGKNSDVNYDKLTGVIGKLEDSQPTATVIIKYYLKPTYSITATYTTVTDGTPSSDPRSSGKQTGDVDAAVPFNRAAYDNYNGFTFNDFVSNSLKVNGSSVTEMPKMEKFQNYDVTLEYRKTVNNPKSTTLNHVFFTVLDNGPETKDENKTLTETIQVTHGQSANMEEYAKKGADYEGYNPERYSHKDKMLPAGGNGTIEYVRHMVTVVFDLEGGTWKNSQDDVNYTVVKNTGLNDQQPVPQPTRNGYDFAGWKAQPDNAVTTGKFDQRTVFTAKWTPKAPTIVNYFYTVTYNYTVTTDGTVTYQDSETTQVQDTTKASQTINASATASHGGYTFDLASPAEQTADLTGTTREAPHKFVVNYVLTVNNGGGGRDDRDDDRPAPKPDPDTEIKDDDVPKSDLPEQPVEIPDEDTPKADLPQAPVDIPDEDTPKADVPKTGDTMGLWVMAAAASGAGLIWLNLTGKKRKDDNG